MANHPDELKAVAHRGFTFRRTRPMTGLASVATPHPDTRIKLGKLVVGEISAPSRFGHEDWLVRFIVPDENDVAGWRWITLRKSFPTEEEARAFVKDNEGAIRRRYTLATCGEDWGD